MKSKLTIGLIMFIATLLGVQVVSPESAHAASWVGIHDNPLVLPGANGRSMIVRHAMQIESRGPGLGYRIRGYTAYTCELNYNPQACSFNWGQDFREEYNHVSSLLSGRQGTVSNTGSDGFWSLYTAWFNTLPCRIYSVNGDTTDPGIAGLRWPGGYWESDSSTWRAPGPSC